MTKKLSELETNFIGNHSTIETLIQSILGCTDIDNVSDQVSIDVCNLATLIQ